MSRPLRDTPAFKAASRLAAQEALTGELRSRNITITGGFATRTDSPAFRDSVRRAEVAAALDENNESRHREGLCQLLPAK